VLSIPDGSSQRCGNRAERLDDTALVAREHAGYSRNAPSGIRTRATALKGPRPGPLVDGGQAKPEYPRTTAGSAGRPSGGARNRTETSRLKVCRPTFGPRPHKECSEPLRRCQRRRCPGASRTWVAMPADPPVPLVKRSGRPPSSDRKCVVELRECAHHGLTEFVLYSGGRRVRRRWRCRRCVGAAVTRRHQKVKRLLVDEAGGCCSICGYDRSVVDLHFHHVDPASKSFSISMASGKSLAAYRRGQEVRALVCQLPRRGRGRSNPTGGGDTWGRPLSRDRGTCGCRKFCSGCRARARGWALVDGSGDAPPCRKTARRAWPVRGGERAPREGARVLPLSRSDKIRQRDRDAASGQGSACLTAPQRNEPRWVGVRQPRGHGKPRAGAGLTACPPSRGLLTIETPGGGRTSPGLQLLTRTRAGSCAVLGLFFTPRMS
jgi:hypothetical protein